MLIIPAIDIKGGNVVRLAQGEAGQETIYSDSPLDVAKRWERAGARLIHIVDMDGAFEGRLKNLGIVKEIAGNIKPDIELGGGIRDEEAIKTILDAGVKKVVIGTRAVDEKFLERAAKKFKDRLVISIDARAGIVHTKGWLDKTGIKALDLLRKIEKTGIKTVNYTDISRDGMLEGPDIKSIRAILGSTKLNVVAGGGISSMDDVMALKELEKDGLKGIIIGKALYEERIDLAEAIRMCEN